MPTFRSLTVWFTAVHLDIGLSPRLLEVRPLMFRDTIFMFALVFFLVRMGFGAGLVFCCCVLLGGVGWCDWCDVGVAFMGGSCVVCVFPCSGVAGIC